MPQRFPTVQVFFPDNTSVYAGTERSSHANSLDQDSFELTNDFTFYVGTHALTVGTHNEFFDFRNLFIQNSFGFYTFTSVANFEAGFAQGYNYSLVPATVTLSNCILTSNAAVGGKSKNPGWALGGAVCVSNGATATMTSDTFSSNSAVGGSASGVTGVAGGAVLFGAAGMLLATLWVYGGWRYADPLRPAGLADGCFTADGTKVSLGVVERSTENATVCRGLLCELDALSTPVVERPHSVGDHAERSLSKTDAVLAFLQPSILNIMIVIGITGWTFEARLVRGEFLRLRGQDFVVASRALGAPQRRTIFRHILPNAMGPVLVAATFSVASGILTESALSFLGLGVTLPVPSWGSLLSESRSPEHWWIQVFPGLMIFVTVMLYNLLGEAVRDALDPRIGG